MADKFWKKAERRIAELFGTERTPLSGSNSKNTSSDTLHSLFYIEIKSGKKRKATKLWLDVVEKAEREKKVPILIEHGWREPIIESRVTIRLSDFLELYKYYSKNK